MSHRPALLWPDEVGQRAGVGLALAGGPIAVYALAMVVADVSTGLSLALYFSVPVLYFLLVTLLNHRETETAADVVPSEPFLG